ncbi:hypothetical protein OBBRIDRAFT_840204 [Obba rivulosa]|uniref:Phosphomannose isomerase type I catalytic domain-containing protein n=1 Tax=Obba rivulosa TaxID=1052685 RepID=A0A8E2AI09_9APHY|nr:hypothetical protein OBBRIDRAFT_840204 [Obba rivulosa]
MPELEGSTARGDGSTKGFAIPSQAADSSAASDIPLPSTSATTLILYQKSAAVVHGTNHMNGKNVAGRKRTRRAQTLPSQVSNPVDKLLPRHQQKGKLTELEKIRRDMEARTRLRAGPPGVSTDPTASVRISNHPATGLTTDVHWKTQIIELYRDVLAKVEEVQVFVGVAVIVTAAADVINHPDKRLAEELHAEGPAAFANDNHKPEIALGPPLRTLRDMDPGADTALVCAEDQDAAFTSFVDFRPLAAIRTFLFAIPKLWRAVGDDALVNSFITIPSPALLTRPDGAEAEARRLGAVIGRGEEARGGAACAKGGRAVHRGRERVHVLVCMFCINYVKPKKGKAISIGTNEVHTYLEGDIECMATSDNVLNAGFVDSAEGRE